MKDSVKEIFGAVFTSAGLIASLKAATVVCQFVSAFCAAIVGLVTLIYVIKKHIQRRQR